MNLAKATAITISKTEAFARRGMVASKDVHATRAGLQMLEAGGNAVDAAVAAAFAIGVVEPTSSGIGGGGYLVYQVGSKGGVIGFPMKGPSAARPGMYALSGQDSVGSFGWAGVVGDENLVGPRSIAVPGAVAGLCLAHRRLGRLPLLEVMDPAIALARDGHRPGWHNLYALGMAVPQLLGFVELRKIFMPGGQLPAGDLASPVSFRQPELADVLEIVGREGPEAFYAGDVARAITSDIQASGGIISERDLAEYRPFDWDAGLEFRYSGHTVRVPPFACAGTTSAMTLKLLDRFAIGSAGHNSTEALHAYICSARLAYADRYEHLADPNFANVPWAGLVSDGYADHRRRTVANRVPDPAEAGNPWAFDDAVPGEKLAASAPAFDSGTTHLCVMDADGNAVSLTNTLMASFGSGFVPKGTGVVMNNGMMWFDPIPGRINSIMPGKYPLNNMTPALVLDSQGVRMSVGASGGRRITNCVTQLISKVIDFGMGPQAAIDSPRLDCSQPITAVDPRIPPEVVARLQARGHQIQVASDTHLEGGFASFASPLVIVGNSGAGFRAGVDTFHSAHAEGL